MSTTHGTQTPAEVVLSAERATLTTRRVPVERVRVRREVVTEEMTLTVTLRREVLRVEREPLTPVHDDATEAEHRAADVGEATLEIVLSAERPVVGVEVVPYERARLSVRPVASSTPVTVAVRHEVADVVATGATGATDTAGATVHPASTS